MVERNLARQNKGRKPLKKRHLKTRRSCPGRKGVPGISKWITRRGEHAGGQSLLYQHPAKKHRDLPRKILPCRNFRKPEMPENTGKMKQNTKNANFVDICVLRAESGETKGTTKISGSENLENFKKIGNRAGNGENRFFKWHFSEANSGGPKGSTS